MRFKPDVRCRKLYNDLLLASDFILLTSNHAFTYSYF